jgi:zinc-ribbon domain
MSQMKPYCFKCGAELDPEAIYCPECGRLQRSMVVRAVEPGATSPPPAQHPDTAHEQPFQFYPDQEAPAAEPAEAQPDQASHYPDSAWHQPDQPDPHAQQQYADQGWQAGEQQDHESWAAEPEQYPEPAPEQYPEPAPEQYPEPAPDAGDHVYAHQADPEPAPHEESWSESGYQGHGHEDPVGHDHAATADPQPGYGHAEHAYEEPSAGQAQQPWQRASEEPHGRREPSPAPPEPPRRPDTWQKRPEPTAYPPPEPTAHPPPEPIYSSPWAAAPGGGYRPYTPPTSRYGGPPANPYAPPYRPDAGDQRQGPGPLRIIALVAAGLLALFLVGFGIGHVLGVGSGSQAPSGAAPQRTAEPSAAATTAPTATAAPTPTSGQGIVGNAKFARVSSTIPGRCTAAQGCPIQVTLKNNGERGSGSVTVTLSDAASGGNTLGTFTGPIPVTDAGATVQVTGFANGDQLPAYLRSGGTVYITSVDIRNGG